jgi:hypothetical protein
MSRFLISVALLVGLSFAVSSAAPLQTYAQVAAEGPRCASPTNPDKTMNCAVMLQMADMLLQTYADGMKECKFCHNTRHSHSLCMLAVIVNSSPHV